MSIKYLVHVHSVAQHMVVCKGDDICIRHWYSHPYIVHDHDKVDEGYSDVPAEI